jgi:hypothetical protein
MTDIEFTDEEVSAMAWGYTYPAEIRAKFVDALPPEPCGHRCGCTSDMECPHYDCPCGGA